MMKMKNRFMTMAMIGITMAILGCGKDFLEKRKDISLAVPRTLEDAELLLNHTNQNLGTTPGLQIISADEITMEEPNLNSLSITERSSFLWSRDFYQGERFNLDWTYMFSQVYYANTVIELIDGIGALEGPQKDRADGLRGRALFHRAHANWWLAQLFAENYRPGQNDGSLGIPLKRTGNIHEDLRVYSLKETYDFILSDLREAKRLLPAVPSGLSSPSKLACDAFFARIFLDIGDYGEALAHADLAIPKLSLMDYNQFGLENDSRRPFPGLFPSGNPEVAYFSSAIPYGCPVFGNGCRVDPQIYASFEEGDLRKNLFFYRFDDQQNVIFRGSYGGASVYALFTGLALDELLLIKAECLARENEGPMAVKVLNDLLETRFDPASFSPRVHTDDRGTLDMVLIERRKQLLARGLRWSDLKRLNREAGHEEWLKRSFPKMGEFVLSPEDPRYIFPIPKEEVERYGLEVYPR